MERVLNDDDDDVGRTLQAAQLLATHTHTCGMAER